MLGPPCKPSRAALATGLGYGAAASKDLSKDEDVALLVLLHQDRTQRPGLALDALSSM